MKRILSMLLGICLIFSACPVKAIASEVHTKYLQVSVNGKIQNYECLWDNKETYCSIETLAEMSNYNWAQIEDRLEFEFIREYEGDTENYGIELQTRVLVKVDVDKKRAKIKAMHESYTMNCYIVDEEVFLPFEKLLYLLHAEYTIEDNIVCVQPMPLTILDFMAIHSIDLVQIASNSEDVLIDTGWLFSNQEWMQRIYSAVAEVFNDFDGKIFMPWWPGEGNVETAECYENAILQLAKEDKEFVGEGMQADAMKLAANSPFSIYSEYTGKIQNIISLPENVGEVIKSIPDAVALLEKAKFKSTRLENIANQIRSGEIDTSIFEIPEFKNKAKMLEEIGDGLGILQCIWNVYDTSSRVETWNEEYLEQLQVLADYKNPGYINENVLGYVRSSGKRLLDSYNNPTAAAANEALQSAIGFGLNKIFSKSPFATAFSIMGAIGSCYGMFDVKSTEVSDVYSELSIVTFSIKVEQLVRELFKDENILTTKDKLTNESIQEARNQLMLYLRLNLRNKTQLYNLNIKGNKDENWVDSENAKELYNEIVKIYSMLAELIETKNCDEYIILSKDYGDAEFNTKKIEKLLLDELPNYTWAVKPEIEADDIFYLAAYPDARYSINELSKQADNPNAVIQKGNELGIIDLDGKLLAEIAYKEIANFGDSYMMIRTIPEYSEEYQMEWDIYWINKNGDITASVGNGDLNLTVYYYYNGARQRAGNLSSEFVQDVIPVQEASEYIDYSVVKTLLSNLKGKYALEQDCNLITDFIYDECGSQSNGLSAVCQNGKWGYVNGKGEVIIPIEYDSSWKQYPVFDIGARRSSNHTKEYCYAASEGYVVLCKDGEWELRDTVGNIIIPKGNFEAIRPVFDGKCWVKKDGKWGVIKVGLDNNVSGDKSLEEKSLTEEIVRTALEQVTEDQVINIKIADYDSDGTKEAFAATSPNGDNQNLYDKVSVWFVNNFAEAAIVETGLWGFPIDELVNVGEHTFYTWEVSGGGSNSFTSIFGVKNGTFYQPEISANYMAFQKSENDNLCKAYEDYFLDRHRYDEIHFEFNEDTGEFHIVDRISDME